MNLTVHYDPGFDTPDLAILQGLEETIKANWVTHSLSTADLVWTLVIDEAEPRRWAALFVRSERYEVLRASLWALERWSPVMFSEDLIGAAHKYRSRGDF